MSTLLCIEDISKLYKLGVISGKTFRDDLRQWWAKKIQRRAESCSGERGLTQVPREENFIWALRNISFEVQEGDIVGIIGKNGAGKSTLLKIISRITAPTSGQVKIKGRLASLLEVGTGFHGELTGRENIFLNGSILGMSKVEIAKCFDEIVDFAELEGFIDTPVKRYSSGMYVRLAFAVAAHLQTEVLVVDEILAVGDIGFQKKCMGKMGKVSESGRTILFVSHRMDHISTLCSRSILLDQGRIVYDGETREALAQYHAQFESRRSGTVQDRTDRAGRGRVKCVDAWIEDRDGKRVETIETGQEVKFVLLVQNMTQDPVRNLKAGVFIFSHTNLHTANLGTWEGGYVPFIVRTLSQITLTVPRFPLNVGKFYYSCVVRSTISDFEIEDHVDDAGNFNVERGDYHRTGETVGGIGISGVGIVSVEHKAEVVHL